MPVENEQLEHLSTDRARAYGDQQLKGNRERDGFKDGYAAAYREFVPVIDGLRAQLVTHENAAGVLAKKLSEAEPLPEGESTDNA